MICSPSTSSYDHDASAGSKILFTSAPAAGTAASVPAALHASKTTNRTHCIASIPQHEGPLTKTQKTGPFGHSMPSPAYGPVTHAPTISAVCTASMVSPAATEEHECILHEKYSHIAARSVNKKRRSNSDAGGPGMKPTRV